MRRRLGHFLMVLDAIIGLVATLAWVVGRLPTDAAEILGTLTMVGLILLGLVILFVVAVLAIALVDQFKEPMLSSGSRSRCSCDRSILAQGVGCPRRAQRHPRRHRHAPRARPHRGRHVRRRRLLA
jgi:hypothetical protein